ncbi:MAG: hypothetical protein VW549_01210 [Methylophilaceae bacterium]|jgi:hypothetical protein
MDEKHREAIAKANKGNKNSSITNRETNKYLKDILRRLVLVQDDGIKAAIPLANTFHVTWLEPCTTLQKPVFHRIENIIPCKIPLT